MKFTLSTKPLQNAVSYGIIKANISAYDDLSKLVQLTADRSTFKINVETESTKTLMELHGSGDSDDTVAIILDCAMFKSLIDSIESDVITFEFVDNGVLVHSGNSVFTLEQAFDAESAQLANPVTQYNPTSISTIRPENWQYIRDHQLFAIATKGDHQAYKYVWVGEDKDVLVGDIQNSLFAHSKFSDFDSTCLLPPTLINLFTTVPEGATVAKLDKNYILKFETDGYSIITEFTPKYEEDETVGSYRSDIIFTRFVKPEDYITVEVSPITKFIKQNAIVNTAKIETSFSFTVSADALTIKNRTSNYTVGVDTADEYTVNFAPDLFRSVLNSLDSERVNIARMTADGVDNNGNPTKVTLGCIFWTDNLTIILAGRG